MASLGDVLYRGSSVWKRLVGNTTTTRKFLTQTGTGSASAAPSWDALALTDLPSSLGQILKASVTLTDAQIKALPTSPITIVAAPAAGKAILPTFGVIYAKTTGGGYTNIDAAGFLQFEGSFVLSFVPNDAAITAGSKTRLSDLLSGATQKQVQLLNYYDTEGVDGWGPIGNVETTVTATALTLSIGNGTSGNLTGGNAANTLKVIVYYTIEDVP